MTNVLEYLEHAAKRSPSKTAVQDPDKSCTYAELLQSAQAVGSAVCGLVPPRSPVIVFTEKSVDALTAFMGIVYAGCFYVMVNPEHPASRIAQILSVTDARLVLTDEAHMGKLKESGYTRAVHSIESLLSTPIRPGRLAQIRAGSADTDPLYCNFTSGSTGVPKGVLVSHRSVIDFISYFTELFHITGEDVIGNQAPFDFDVSVKDIYSCFSTGAKLVIIPKKMFSIPVQLLDYLCEHKVTTLIWAVSALCMITTLKGFTYRVPQTVNKVLFSGEAMPIRHLNQWRKYLPDALYVNLYGPTEITCNCTYYVVEREFAKDESLPIGRPFPNERVFLLDETDNLITAPEQTGEVCVAGTALALGYYNAPQQTAKAFVQNPLNRTYPETIYRTGDLAYYNTDGDLVFAGRKDFQIKHMGHRIELEEIERSMGSCQGVVRACCVFDTKRNRIVAFYVGETEKDALYAELAAKLPVYMIPSVFHKMESLPVTPNGKLDRKLLLSMNGGM